MTRAFAKCFASMTACVFIVSACAVGQAAAGFNPLAIPTSGYWECDFQLLTSKDSAANIALRYHFTDGEAMHSDRDIETAYDSSGAPISIVLLATEVIANGEIWTRPLLVFFGKPPADSTYGIRTVRSSDSVRAIPQSPATVPKGWERLSRDDTDKARTLAIWLRDNRCRRPPTGSLPPPEY